MGAPTPQRTRRSGLRSSRPPGPARPEASAAAEHRTRPHPTRVLRSRGRSGAPVTAGPATAQRRKVARPCSAPALVAPRGRPRPIPRVAELAHLPLPHARRDGERSDQAQPNRDRPTCRRHLPVPGQRPPALLILGRVSPNRRGRQAAEESSAPPRRSGSARASALLAPGRVPPNGRDQYAVAGSSVAPHWFGSATSGRSRTRPRLAERARLLRRRRFLGVITPIRVSATSRPLSPKLRPFAPARPPSHLRFISFETAVPVCATSRPPCFRTGSHRTFATDRTSRDSLLSHAAPRQQDPSPLGPRMHHTKQARLPGR